MIKALALALLLSLALVTPVSAAGRLSANPTPVEFGQVTVGSCNLETFAGCVVKTVTITANRRTRIAGFGVTPSGDVGLSPTSSAGDCSRLAVSGKVWTLRAGRSCTIKVAMAPSLGPVERTLRVWSPTKTLLSIPLRAEGV